MVLGSTLITSASPSSLPTSHTLPECFFFLGQTFLSCFQLSPLLLQILLAITSWWGLPRPPCLNAQFPLWVFRASNVCSLLYLLPSALIAHNLYITHIYWVFFGPFPHQNIISMRTWSSVCSLIHLTPNRYTTHTLKIKLKCNEFYVWKDVSNFLVHFSS